MCHTYLNGIATLAITSNKSVPIQSLRDTVLSFQSATYPPHKVEIMELSAVTSVRICLRHLQQGNYLANNKQKSKKGEFRLDIHDPIHAPVTVNDPSELITSDEPDVMPMSDEHVQMPDERLPSAMHIKTSSASSRACKCVMSFCVSASTKGLFA